MLHKTLTSTNDELKQSAGEYLNPIEDKENQLKLIKAQADMLGTELAHEKVRLARVTTRICRKSDECENLEKILKFLISTDNGIDSSTINLEGKRIMIIGGCDDYARVIRHFVEKSGGKMLFLSRDIDPEKLTTHTQDIASVDMVMFQSNTYSELDLWNAAREMCERYVTRFTILGKPSLSCFVNRARAAFPA